MADSLCEFHGKCADFLQIGEPAADIACIRRATVGKIQTDFRMSSKIEGRRRLREEIASEKVGNNEKSGDFELDLSPSEVRILR
jgi:hypothetical protein